VGDDLFSFSPHAIISFARDLQLRYYEIRAIDLDHREFVERFANVCRRENDTN